MVGRFVKFDERSMSMIGTKACIKGGHFMWILRRGPEVCGRQMVCSDTTHPFIDAETHPVIGAVH